ncbi:hypothetical protein DPMN_169025 [Dreissena polymorpha]|uniref:Uncharacterized protein n=1 Tax=Dreissena polymorpha TaxID=45954 RepID=A0A9D4J068_DREPO|nr:hypothetical protein DPMN_169025 [Dreissena polymorpha]
MFIVSGGSDFNVVLIGFLLIFSGTDVLHGEALRGVSGERELGSAQCTSTPSVLGKVAPMNTFDWQSFGFKIVLSLTTLGVLDSLCIRLVCASSVRCSACVWRQWRVLEDDG